MPPVATIDGAVAGPVDVWLSATIGLYPLLAGTLAEHTQSGAPIVRIDDRDTTSMELMFFRANAALVLPAPGVARIGVAGLLARPGRHDAHLSLAGPFDWPAERRSALRCLERLVQRGADQWLAPRALWAIPAEQALAGEVV